MEINFDSEEKPLLPINNDGTGSYITIFLTSQKTSFKKNFRCVNCGKLIFQYDSEIGLIVDSGEHPLSKALFETICHRCNTIYRILW